MREAEDNLEAANRVASLLAAHGVPGVVIGQVALAIHAICLKSGIRLLARVQSAGHFRPSFLLAPAFAHHHHLMANRMSMFSEISPEFQHQSMDQSGNSSLFPTEARCAKYEISRRHNSLFR